MDDSVRVGVGETLGDLAAKCAWYVANGVLVALLADDRDETLQVVRSAAASVTVPRGDALPLPELGPDLALATDELFRVLDPD